MEFIFTDKEMHFVAYIHVMSFHLQYNAFLSGTYSVSVIYTNIIVSVKYIM